jgi:hypothetical protein
VPGALACCTLVLFKEKALCLGSPAHPVSRFCVVVQVGDAVEKRDFVLGNATLLSLAGPANRQGRLAADAIFGADVKFRGVQGTSVCGLFDLTLGRTGAGEKDLVRAGVPYNKVHIHPYQHVEYIPGGQQMHLKVLFEPVSGKLLGAQCVGKAGVDKRIDVLAMAIQMGATVFDLEESELCYAPQYGAAKVIVICLATATPRFVLSLLCCAHLSALVHLNRSR